MLVIGARLPAVIALGELTRWSGHRRRRRRAPRALARTAAAVAPAADPRPARWIALLEREGELVRVAAEVDPYLEVDRDRRPRRSRPAGPRSSSSGRRAASCRCSSTSSGPSGACASPSASSASTTWPRSSREVLEMQPPRGSRREGARPAEAQVDRRLAPAHRPQRRRARRSSCAATTSTSAALPVQTLLARRRGAVHHAAGRDHARPAHRAAQRRHVPDAGARPALDGDALAAAQGRPRRLPRSARAGWRSRSRSGSTR